MSPDRRPPLRPEDVTWEELRRNAEASWPLIGPSSQGGTTLYRYEGRLFTVGYGEHSSLPGGAEQVIAAGPDNTPGFPPRMPDGHAAGCRHEPHRDCDWWMHHTCLFRIQRGEARLFENAREVWTCPVEAFSWPDSPQRADVLRRLGPAVLDEALRCAARRLAR